MDTNEQALVQVEAAPLAAPSAAVAGLVAASIAPNTKRSYEAALKRLDAALEGQDLTDASLSVYIASLHAVGCVFRSKVATHFGARWPPNSEQSGHPFRSESGRFFAAAETGGRHVPK